MDLCQDVSLKVNTPERECKKKQIKMWFSPRRRKVRYVLEREEICQPTPSHCAQAPLVPCYEFVSSSPNVEPVQKKSVKKPRKTKKKTLKDINKEWGFAPQKRLEDLNQKRHVAAQNERNGNLKESEVLKQNRSVSFCSSPVVLQTHDVEQESDYKCGLLASSGLAENESRLEEPTEVQTNNRDGDLLKSESPVLQSAVVEQDKDCNSDLMKRNGKNKTRSEEPTKEQPNIRKSVRCTRLRSISSGSPKRENKIPVKRKDHPSGSPVSGASKRLRKREIGHADDSSSEKSTCVQAKNEIYDEPRPSQTPSKSPSTPSSHQKDGRRTSQIGNNNQTSPSNFSVAKKNHKGETMLHVASIKGDLQAVEELLRSGANPNVKDHAGWTPLHEACNHGHTNVVELLLQYQALVNTTGYQNDTPLHDASRNGHLAVVRLLLSHGASQDTVNIFGLRPVDYAEAEEIKSALLQTQTSKEPLVRRPASFCQSREGAAVLLASGLSTAQRADFTKLAQLLRAEVCANYNSSVTHVVVGDEPTLRTMKCMMGTLAGCWILRWAWVKASLESLGQEPEEVHEVQGGPHRARLNREQLLPRLLDGCHFYFLGSFGEHRKEDLIELAKAAGGQILIRQPKPDSDVTQTINTVAYHADAESDQRFCTQYIIYDKASKYTPNRVRQGKVWFAPSSWLIECITCFQLLPVPQG
ncbi:BRCA1-associated RING domain protein 1 isoform X2 [Pseudophryne corroboree]